MPLTMQRTTTQQLHEWMTNSETHPVVINALSDDAFRAKRIPGSINLTEENLECAENIMPDKDQDIVVYCANSDCDASTKLAEKLTDMGYTNVWDYEEGIAGWRNAGHSLTGTEVS